MERTLLEKTSEIIASRSALGSAPDGALHCVLALLDDDGYPTASTITIAKADGMRELWFDTGLTSNSARRITACSRASVCLSADDYNITLVGDMEVCTDPKVKKEAWYDAMGNHMTGPDDPNYCVLIFRTRRYNLLVDWQQLSGTL